jgi:hypothetical protein
MPGRIQTGRWGDEWSMRETGVALGGVRCSNLRLDIDRQIQGRFICAGGTGGAREAGGAAARYPLL